MLSITDLPRKDGIVTGEFLARHRSPSFSLEGYGFKFSNGVTLAPVLGRVADRLHAAFGGDVSFEPRDGDSACLALAWMRSRGLTTARFERALSGPELAIEAVAEARTVAIEQPHVTFDALAPTPANHGELMALGERELRAIAEEMGATDKRWKVGRLRRFIADELGIEMAGDN